MGAIELQPTGNRQGGYYFYIILTGRCLNSRSWNTLPIPDEAIQSIEKMNRRRYHGYNFTYHYSTAILDDYNNDGARYAPYDHEDDDEYPSFHQNTIIEPDISGVDNNINTDDADNNTDDANTNAEK